MAVTDGNIESGYISGNGIWKDEDVITADSLNNIEQALNNNENHTSIKTTFQKYNFKVTFNTEDYKFGDDPTTSSSSFELATISIKKNFNELGIKNFKKNTLVFVDKVSSAALYNYRNPESETSFQFMGSSNNDSIGITIQDHKRNSYYTQCIVNIDFKAETIKITRKQNYHTSNDFKPRETEISFSLYCFETIPEIDIVI